MRSQGPLNKRDSKSSKYILSVLKIIAKDYFATSMWVVGGSGKNFTMPNDLLMSFIFFLECGPPITCVSNHSLVDGMFSVINSRDRHTSFFAKEKLYK